jgi:hypothetical protein
MTAEQKKRAIRAYFRDQRRIAWNSPLLSQHVVMASLRLDESLNEAGRAAIVTKKTSPLRLPNGASLRVVEVIRVDPGTGQVERIEYAYEYREAQGVFFRYERDQRHRYDGRGNLRLDHPEYHLHVNARVPRYPAPAISLEQILSFIDASFVSSER